MSKSMGVESFKAMFQEIGLDEKAMKKWHRVFEARHPESHQAFLAWLGLSPEEINHIRAESR
ncbi:MAG: hypothetical protein R6X19_06605 [Kiritimatiellia bacterium]